MGRHTSMKWFKKSSKRWVVVALALSSGAFSLVGLSSPIAPAGASQVPNCTTSDIVVWINSTGSGAAGSVYYHLEFTNLSAHACAFAGFPGVSAVDLSGHQLGMAAGRNSAHPSNVMTLTSAGSNNTSGSTAIAVLQITDTGVFSHSACAPVTAAGLRVYLPGQTSSRVVPFPFIACSHRGPIYLHIESLQR